MDMKTYVEQRLAQWADWYCRCEDHSLGYRRQSIEARLMEEGGMLISAHGRPPLPIHDAAEEIETSINLLAKQNSNLAKALRYKYVERGSLRQKAIELGISHTQFKVYVDMAVQWLAGMLTRQAKC